MQSPMLWDPIRYLETCPSSDGAIALVVASEEVAKKGPRKPAWIKSRRLVRRGDVGAGPRPGEPGRRPRLRQARLRAGRHHRSVEPDRHRRDLRAVLLVRGHVAREPRLLRRSARAGRSSSAASRSSAPTCPSTPPAACCAPTRSAPPACCVSAKPRCRSWAAPAPTRSKARRPRSATPTAAGRSILRCGSSAASCDDGENALTGAPVDVTGDQ